MTIEKEIWDQLEKDATERIEYENAWLDILELAFPMGGYAPSVGGIEGNRAALNELTRELSSARRGEDLYDTTMYRAINTVSAGVEGFMTPQGQKWSPLTISDLSGAERTHAEDLWIDKTTNFLFAQRYDSDSGFATANSQAIRSTVALGTGVFMTEGTEDIGQLEDMLRYSFFPLFECYMGADSRGRNDRLYRWSQTSAVNLAKRYGFENLSSRVQHMVDDPDQRNDLVEYVHAVQLRDEKGMRGRTNRDSLYASYVIERETKHMITDGGYFTWPFTVYKWSNAAHQAYGETPVMALLGNVKSLHQASKHQDIALQQAVLPPTATVGEYDVDLNPGAINPGLLDKNGQPMWRSMMENARPDISGGLIEVKQAELERAMGTHLWITTQDHQMTAFEVMKRDQERILQLGPAGNIIQEAQGQQTDRELDIMGRRGVFTQGQPLEPPASIIQEGANVQAEFDSPYSRARRLGEIDGINLTTQTIAQMAQIDPKYRHMLDGENTIRNVRSISGAPADMLVDEETFNALVEAEQQAVANRQAVETANTAAQAAKTGAEAQQAANDSGISEGPIGQAVQAVTGG